MIGANWFARQSLNTMGQSGQQRDDTYTLQVRQQDYSSNSLLERCNLIDWLLVIQVHGIYQA